MVPARNPHAKPKENVAQTAIMGPQSQRRLTLKERTHQMQGSNVGHKKGKKGDQQTLTGEVTFDPMKDCAICKARHIGHAEPHAATTNIVGTTREQEACHLPQV